MDSDVSCALSRSGFGDESSRRAVQSSSGLHQSLSSTVTTHGLPDPRQSLTAGSSTINLRLVQSRASGERRVQPPSKSYNSGLESRCSPRSCRKKSCVTPAHPPEPRTRESTLRIIPQLSTTKRTNAITTSRSDHQQNLALSKSESTLTKQGRPKSLQLVRSANRETPFHAPYETSADCMRTGLTRSGVVPWLGWPPSSPDANGQWCVGGI